MLDDDDIIKVCDEYEGYLNVVVIVNWVKFISKTLTLIAILNFHRFVNEAK